MDFDCCKCCHTRKDRLVHASDSKVKDELKIIRWIQFMRTTSYVFSKIFTKEQWEKIEKASKFRKISLSDDDEKEEEGEE